MKSEMAMGGGHQTAAVVVVDAILPRGMRLTNGSWLRRARVRPMTGHDEQFLLDLPAEMPLHLKVIAFLERVVALDGLSNTGDALKQMSIGDRVSLMLHARRLVLGDRIRCTVGCTACGRAMSADLSVSALHMQKTQAVPPQEHYDVEAFGFRLQVRPLTGADQDTLLLAASAHAEASSAVAAKDVQGGAPSAHQPDAHALKQSLARSCIVHAEPPIPSGSSGAPVPEPLLEAIGARLGEVDPLSDIVLALSCPECGHAFRASFPAESFVFRELAANVDQLERDVHWLAFNYHWGEQEILSLSTAKRKRYVELVNATLAGEGV
jgi:hypothetical protein